MAARTSAAWDERMDLTKLDTIILQKRCPACNLGLVRETSARVYACDHAKCGEVYDFSVLTDSMLKLLLDPENDRRRIHRKGK